MLLGVLLLIGYWCLNRYNNCFTLDCNQLAFTVPETVINMIVGRCFCYHEIDPLVSPFLCAWYNQCIQSALSYKFFSACCTYEDFYMLGIFKKTTIIKKSCVSVNEVKMEI